MNREKSEQCAETIAGEILKKVLEKGSEITCSNVVRHGQDLKLFNETINNLYMLDEIMLENYSDVIPADEQKLIEKLDIDLPEIASKLYIIRNIIYGQAINFDEISRIMIDYGQAIQEEHEQMTGEKYA